MKSDLDIQFFLHLGYFQEYEPKIVLNSVKNKDQENTAEEAILLFRASIASSFQTDKRNVVPLSGGLDSRAILAALLELTEAQNIETYTFGTPGTYDYDIGCLVAQQAGTRHTAIPLDSHPWREEYFTEAAKRSDYQTFLMHHPPLSVIDQFKGGVIWSGYIGDLVTGGHLRNNSSATLEEAKVKYLQSRRTAHSMNLIKRDLSDFSKLIGQRGNLHPALSYDEQVMFSEVGRITAPHVLIQGFDYIMPFINTPFYDFFMGLPAPLRRGQKLFKEMLIKNYPALFNLPCKNAYGLPLQASTQKKLLQRARNKLWNLGRSHLRFIDFPALPMTNYFDVDTMLRKNKNFSEMVYVHLQDLKARQIVPWINIDKIWQHHQSRAANHGDAIKILFSLEMNLKGGA